MTSIIPFTVNIDQQEEDHKNPKIPTASQAKLQLLRS